MMYVYMNHFNIKFQYNVVFNQMITKILFQIRIVRHRWATRTQTRMYKTKHNIGLSFSINNEYISNVNTFSFINLKQ